MAELEPGASGLAGGDGEVFPSFCPKCGSPLTSPRCPDCVLLSQLRHTAAEIGRWESRGLLTPGAAASLRSDLLARSRDAVERVTGQTARRATPVAPPAIQPPALKPGPPAEPQPSRLTEWQRFRAATGVSWVYAVGVLFLVAGLAWLVIEASRSVWGRWALSMAIGAVAVGSLKGGWYLLHRLELRLGGQALLTIGSLMTSAALFAAASASGQIDALTAAAIWATGSAVGFVDARRGQLGSQLVLGNLLAAVVAWDLARLATGPASAGWFGALAAGLAAINLVLSLRSHRSEESASDEMATAAKASAVALLFVGTLAVLPAAFPGQTATWPALAGLLMLAVCAVGSALGQRQPGWLLAAATYGYVAGLLSDRLGVPSMAWTWGILALLATEGRTRQTDEFRGWMAGLASVALLCRLPSVMPGLVSGHVTFGTLGSALALTIGYLTAGLIWEVPWLVAIGAGMAAFTAWAWQVFAGYSAATLPLLQALVAGMLLALGARLAFDAEDERQADLTDAAWVPLGIGGLVALGQLAEWYVGGWAWSPHGAAGPDIWLALGAVALAGLGMWTAQTSPRPWAAGGEAALLAVAVLALLLAPGERLSLGLLGSVVGAGLVVRALLSQRSAEQFADLGGAALIAGQGLTILQQFAQGPRWEFVAASATAAASAGYLAWRGPIGSLPAKGWRVLAVVAGAWTMAGLTGLRADCQALGMAIAAAAASRLNRQQDSTLSQTVLALAGMAALGSAFERPVVALWAMVVAQLALWDSAGQSRASAGLAASTWLLAALIWGTIEPGWEALNWPLHALAGFGLGALWIASHRPGGMAAGLLMVAVGQIHVGRAWCPEHQPLWFGVFALLAWAGAGRSADADEVKQATTIGALASALATLAAVGLDQRLDAMVLLSSGTAATGWLWRAGKVSIAAPVSLANLTAAYLLVRVWEAHDNTVGLRLALLALANSAAAYVAASQRELRHTLLVAGGLVGLLSWSFMFPADRNTVLAFICLGAALMTVSATLDDVRLQDVGALFFLAALFMVLQDLAEHGRPGLSPYRAVDLWIIPVGLYLLAVVERRAEDRVAVRRCAIVLILGSVLLSAVVAEGIGHDLLLLLAVAGSVFLGIERDDAVARWSGIATFAAYVQFEVWRQRPEWGTLLLIAMLSAAGAAAILAGLRQEKLGRE